MGMSTLKKTKDVWHTKKPDPRLENTTVWQDRENGEDMGEGRQPDFCSHFQMAQSQQPQRVCGEVSNAGAGQ